MRPIKLKIKGLNSFIEEQTVDFERLTRQGFFGIFGPTGSGKSTILDGMILALYGIRAISRGTSEFINKNCKSAKVSYEFQISGAKVKKYRVEREFKASEKGAKSGKCRLLELTEGEVVLEESVTGVDRACTEIIGLTADDFMRTVVLPQGKFSEFLRVSGKDRREILERLFRLEEYGGRLEERIAKAIKEWQSEKTRLLGQSEIYGGYSEETLDQLKEQTDVGQKELACLEKRQKEALKEMEEYKKIRELQETFQSLNQNMEQLKVQEGEIEKKRQLLLMADRAEHVLPLLNSVRELEEKEAELSKRITEEKKRYDSWRAENTKRKEAFCRAEIQKEAQEEGLIADVTQAEEAVKDYEKLPELMRLKKEQERQREVFRKNEELFAEREERVRAKREVNQTELTNLEKRLQFCIVTSEYREKIDGFTTLYNELAGIYEDKKEREKVLSQKTTQIKQLEKEAESFQKEADSYEKLMKALREEASGLSEDVEHIQVLQIRKKLKRGEPCPVCGSFHFEQEEIKEKEDTKLDVAILEKIEEIEEHIAKAEESFRKANQYVEIRRQLLRARQEEFLESEEKWKKVSEVMNEKKEYLKRELEQCQIESLKEERERIRKADQNREQVEKERGIIQKTLSELEETWKGIQEERSEQQKRWQKLELELVPLSEKIIQKEERIASKIGKGRNPQVHLKSLKDALLELRKNYSQAKADKEEAESELRKYEELWQMLNGTWKGNAEALSNAKIHFQKELKNQGFADRKEVENAVPGRSRYEEYKEQIDAFEKKMQETNTKIFMIQAQLDGKSVEKDVCEESERLCRELEAEYKERERQIIEWKQEMRRIEEILKQQEEVLKKLKETEHHLSVLEDLRSVTRGKRFVEFMALERLRYISKGASKRLFEITNGNYELEINDEGEFVIRDNKNGGVLRQTATLSGGETFVTSLALALALSAEIQLKGTAPLELFFLDEGFGSLDDTLLDVVMESLEKIHNEQLKVGIISHVESVKSRVPVRLLVSSARTGISGSKVEIEYS